MTDLTEPASRIPHKMTCEGGDPRLVMLIRGDAAVRCTSCERWAVLDPARDRKHAEPAAAPEQEPTPEPVRQSPLVTAPPRPRFGYRCRIHQEQSVRQDGRGCVRCHDDAQLRHELRDRARRRHRDAVKQVEPSWSYV